MQTKLISVLTALIFMMLSAVAMAASWVNLNTATLDELDALPGIGPSKAQAIIDHRSSNGPFRTVEQLDDVKGFGPATIDKLRPYLSINDSPPKAAPPPSASASSAKSAAAPRNGAKVNLNTASASELETIPGVGASRAQLIIERREQVGPFTDPAQIMEIKGVGPKTFEKMEGHITVQ